MPCTVLSGLVFTASKIVQQYFDNKPWKVIRLKTNSNERIVGIALPSKVFKEVATKLQRTFELIEIQNQNENWPEDNTETLAVIPEAVENLVNTLANQYEDENMPEDNQENEMTQN